ncbi:MAG: prepilin-type N-terminal cleavage/methylation domain-containing protein [candidate division WOR-3 bacterium]
MGGAFKRGFREGFTLVELMVVIAIIGVIFVIAVPNFAAMQANARIRAGAYEVAQDLRQIRERALSLGRSFKVDAVDQRTYRVTNPDNNSYSYRLGGPTGGNLKFGVSGNYAGGLPPEANGAVPANGFDFLPSGILTFNGRGGANKGVIYITDGRHDYAIGINSLGKVRVYKYGNGSWN